MEGGPKNIINVPESVFKEGKVEKAIHMEVVGSLDFSFCKVPYDLDGDLRDIYDEDGKEKEGIENMEEIDIASIPSPKGLSLNVSGMNNVNSDTGGVFLHFLGGGVGQRYILLKNKRKELEALRSNANRVTDEFRRKFLEVFIKNADLAIEKYGDNAAILLF
jgi:hypothetical protein